ncbi:MAG: type III pantothenate kinase [Rhodospirillales bacterium]|nr:type III pantothenate kinase [Rhodospirillales bacterium]
MLLAIDSGNTNIVFAVFDDGGGIRGQWRFSTDSERTADEFGVWLTQLMRLDGFEGGEISASIIATVVPAVLFNLKTLCRKYFECDPLVVGEAAVDLGLQVLVERPEDVGADRLANAAGAHEHYGGPLIVVDFGTATTFDIIDADGNYYGGIIAPGVNLSLEALHMAAAQLPRVAIGRPEKVIGKNTVAAMQSGMFWGYIGMIEGLIRRICDEFGAEMKVIATGGLARLFAQSTNGIRLSDPDLTLKGLLAIHRRNHRPHNHRPPAK